MPPRLHPKQWQENHTDLHHDTTENITIPPELFSLHFQYKKEVVKEGGRGFENKVQS